MTTLRNYTPAKIRAVNANKPKRRMRMPNTARRGRHLEESGPSGLPRGARRISAPKPGIERHVELKGEAMDIRRWKMGGGGVGAGGDRGGGYGEGHDDLQKQLRVRKQFTPLIEFRCTM